MNVIISTNSSQRHWSGCGTVSQEKH